MNNRDNVIDISKILLDKVLEDWYNEVIEVEREGIKVYKTEPQIISFELFEAYRQRKELERLIDKWEKELNNDYVD
jgi:hypothetical protein|tara:strand:+ start:370 stop:597 length:228 start_codon:yes stop_codon:yes gene_type:complete